MRFFLVMEYLERGSIVDNVKRGQYDLVESFMDHAKQLASTVAWLHLRGIVHRDIKPGNVLLDASGGIKLCDLGVSRYLPGSATELFGQASNATASQRETYGSATMTINIGTVKCVPSFSSSSSSSSSSPPLLSSPSPPHPAPLRSISPANTLGTCRPSCSHSGLETKHRLICSSHQPQRRPPPLCPPRPSTIRPSMLPLLQQRLLRQQQKRISKSHHHRIRRMELAATRRTCGSS